MQLRKRIFFASSCARCYPTVTATSHRGISARFDRDIKYVIIDASLVRRRVATSRRGCRPQRVDFGRKKSTRGYTQINNQPTTGASKCRGPFGEARAEGKRQSHQRLRCLRSRDQHCNKSHRHLSSADDRRWDDGRWCNRRRRRTIDGGAGGQGWEDEDDETG